MRRASGFDFQPPKKPNLKSLNPGSLESRSERIASVFVHPLMIHIAGGISMGHLEKIIG